MREFRFAVCLVGLLWILICLAFGAMIALLPTPPTDLTGTPVACTVLPRFRIDNPFGT